MIAAVVEVEIDMALGVFADLPPQIEAQVLFRDAYACLLDPSGQPQPYTGLTADRYWAAPHVLVAVHGKTPTELDLSLRRYRMARHIALILPHWGVAPQVIQGSDLILTVARRCLTNVSFLEITAPPLELPTIPFSAISHTRRRADPALRWLAEEVRGCLDV
ncbi:LysR substrate-binding domain-containing protein [Frigidibacter mobilis]|uniref:LysR family transcriptional regulator n=1 Tax=Frigidibacter mobilis TaxID=1335048 RepID=A0A159Z8V5_9RHOB|nr:LysR substrate-binding domain-containing protein [Frigidibacter mobilis]AMY71120.1 LysR family transcriptional regulator [Frigidibacter mobilis]